MVINAPLPFVSHGCDLKIHGPVDQADASSACASGGCGDNVQKALRRFGTGLMGATARDHPPLLVNLELDSPPFPRQSSGDRYRFHVKNVAEGPTVNRARLLPNSK